MGYRNNLFEVVNEASITTLLVDMDKTLTVNGSAYSGVPETMEKIVNSGVKVFVVTNSTVGSAELLRILEKRGLEYNRHFTDAFSAGSVLRDFWSSPAMQGKKVLTMFGVLDNSIFSSGGNVEVCHVGFDFSLLQKKMQEFNPDYIYVGTPYKDKFSMVPLKDIYNQFGKHINFLAQAEKPLLAGFKDANFFEYGQYIVIQGDILKAVLERNPYARIKTFGKPDTVVFEALARKYPEVKYNKATTMMVGDNPETDLRFARNLGIQYTHVLTSKGLGGEKANYLIPAVSGEKTPEPDLKALFNLIKHNDFCHV